MGQKVLLIFFINSLAFGTSIASGTTQVTWTTKVDLTGYPVHDQGQVGTCYANALAVMIDTLIRKEDAKWVSSPLGLASYYAITEHKTGPFEEYDILSGGLFKSDTIAGCAPSSVIKVDSGGQLCKTFEELKKHSYELSRTGYCEGL